MFKSFMLAAVAMMLMLPATLVQGAQTSGSNGMRHHHHHHHHHHHNR